MHTDKMDFDMLFWGIFKNDKTTRPWRGYDHSYLLIRVYPCSSVVRILLILSVG